MNPPEPEVPFAVMGWQPTDEEIEEKLIELTYTWGDIEEKLEAAGIAADEMSRRTYTQGDFEEWDPLSGFDELVELGRLSTAIGHAFGVEATYDENDFGDACVVYILSFDVADAKAREAANEVEKSALLRQLIIDVARPWHTDHFLLIKRVPRGTQPQGKPCHRRSREPGARDTFASQMGTPTQTPPGLSFKEIRRIVNRYIGVSDDGYLGDFSYRTHTEFYPEYCDLDIDPFDYLTKGTTRERFIHVLEAIPPHDQAKIIRGVVEKYPLGSSELRTQESYDELVAMAERLERGGMVVASPAMTSEVVRRAMDDAEALLKNGPTSAVDRLHTMLHGHLQYLCTKAGIPFAREDTMVALLKKLRQSHPNLADLGPRAQDVETVLKASGSILDALNPVRNNASVAHPNQQLLERDEAQLVINVGRSLLSYLDAKTVG